MWLFATCAASLQRLEYQDPVVERTVSNQGATTKGELMTANVDARIDELAERLERAAKGPRAAGSPEAAAIANAIIRAGTEIALALARLEKTLERSEDREA